MAHLPRPPRSPSLEPPRKSVELEDSGAHELSGSENEDDHFSDAQESRQTVSRPTSPIPTTRVEKIDDEDSYGEVPGTPAYKMREKDAVPDEIKILPHTKKAGGNSSPDTKSPLSPISPRIPKTIVEKIDPLSPSHGEVPGTPAHLKRMADAVPDVVRPISPSKRAFPDDEQDQSNDYPSQSTIPTTIITKVDSEPRHGEVPGTDAFEKRRGDADPDMVEKKGDVRGASDRSSRHRVLRTIPVTSASPIAADGGFGPMASDDTEDSDETSAQGLDGNDNEDAGDDFDDFEAGEEDEDFGEFDQPTAGSDGSGPEDIPSPRVAQAPAVVESQFPLLDFNELHSADDVRRAARSHLEAVFPTTKDPRAPPEPLPAGRNSIFLSDRSLSLWSQLVTPPPLQPPNWVRSRIRRLFLVSLGVPIDLDEILPASKQKKLVLPSMHARSGSQTPPEDRRGTSKGRLRPDNESSTSVDKASSKGGRRKRGTTAPPEMDTETARILCATSKEALQNMTGREIQVHVAQVKELTFRANELLEYWLKQRDNALSEKETFEGVIENLVKHARRVRQ